MLFITLQSSSRPDMLWEYRLLFDPSRTLNMDNLVTRQLRMQQSIICLEKLEHFIVKAFCNFSRFLVVRTICPWYSAQTLGYCTGIWRSCGSTRCLIAVFERQLDCITYEVEEQPWWPEWPQTWSPRPICFKPGVVLHWQDQCGNYLQ